MYEMDVDNLCSICLDLPNDEAMTSCNHFFCRICILKILAMQFSQNHMMQCPYCRQEIEYVTFLKVPASELAERYWHLGSERLEVEGLRGRLQQLLALCHEFFEDDVSVHSSTAASEETLTAPERAVLLPFALSVAPLVLHFLVSRLLKRFRGN